MIFDALFVRKFKHFCQPLQKFLFHLRIVAFYVTHNPENRFSSASAHPYKRRRLIFSVIEDDFKSAFSAFGKICYAPRFFCAVGDDAFPEKNAVFFI